MTSRVVRRLDAAQKVPRNGARRAGSVHSPVQVERYVEARLLRMSRALAAEVRRIVLPRVADFARPPPEERADSAHVDAKDKAARSGSDRAAANVLAAQMRSAASRTFSEQATRSVTEQASRRVEAHSKDQFRLLGISVKKEPDLKWLVKGWAKDVAARVKGVTDEQSNRLADLLSNGSKREASSIAKDVEEILGVVGSRASFIARDAVGTLNSKITRHRQEAAGIDQYVWTSVGDSRVRDKHQELDGEIFDVDGPGDPDEGHAGEPAQCRCVAWPLPPTSKDDEDVAEEDDDS